MAQWIGLGIGGIKRAGRVPEHVRKKLRDRRPFRRRQPPPAPSANEAPPPA